MATDMTGLFGPTPEELQQQRMTGLRQNAMEYAKMDPFQQATAGIYQGAGMLTDVGARALGGVNPQEQMAQQARGAVQGIDTSTYEGLMEGARRLMNVNPALAQRWVQEARKVKEAQTSEELKRSQIKKNEAYQPAGARDPETLQLLEEMSVLEEQGLQDSAKYKALEARVKFLSTAKGGVFGAGTVKRMSTNIGEVIFDPATKKYTFADGSEIPVDKLREMKPLGNDPVNAAAVAQAKAGASTIGKLSATAQGQLPTVETNLKMVEDLGTKLFAHPGYQSLVGAGWPGLAKLAGSNVPGAKALFDQISGIGYIMGREDLRGQGQVTEGEANAAVAAYNRMNTSMSEKDFRDAYNDFVQRVKNVRDILSQKKGMTYSLPTVSPMPQGASANVSVAPMPNGAEADQIATYRKEYQDAKRKLNTPGENKQSWTEYIAGLEREAKSKGFSLEGDIYPNANSKPSVPAVEKWQRIGGRLVKVQ